MPHRLSDIELLKFCGSSNDITAWQEFVRRFHRKILLYTLRERRSIGLTDNEADAVCELVKKVYINLLANGRRLLLEYRGKKEFSLLIYLAHIVRVVVCESSRH
jgi:hypothetical protein